MRLRPVQYLQRSDGILFHPRRVPREKSAVAMKSLRELALARVCEQLELKRSVEDKTALLQGIPFYLLPDIFEQIRFRLSLDIITLAAFSQTMAMDELVVYEAFHPNDLFPIISGVTSLQLLHIAHGENVKDEHLKALSQLESLQTIRMYGCADITAHGLLMLPASLQRLCVFWQPVKLSNPITTVDFIKIMDRFPLLKQLEVRGFHSIGVDVLQMQGKREKSLLECLSVPLLATVSAVRSSDLLETWSRVSRIKTLDLSQSQIKDADIVYCLQLKELQLLNVSQTRVTEAGLIQGAKLLKQQTDVKYHENHAEPSESQLKMILCFGTRIFERTDVKNFGFDPDVLIVHDMCHPNVVEKCVGMVALHFPNYMIPLTSAIMHAFDQVPESLVVDLFSSLTNLVVDRPSSLHVLIMSNTLWGFIYPDQNQANEDENEDEDSKSQDIEVHGLVTAPGNLELFADGVDTPTYGQHGESTANEVDELASSDDSDDESEDVLAMFRPPLQKRIELIPLESWLCLANFSFLGRNPQETSRGSSSRGQTSSSIMEEAVGLLTNLCWGGYRTKSMAWREKCSTPMVCESALKILEECSQQGTLHSRQASYVTGLLIQSSCTPAASISFLSPHAAIPERLLQILCDSVNPQRRVLHAPGHTIYNTVLRISVLLFNLSAFPSFDDRVDAKWWRMLSVEFSSQVGIAQVYGFLAGIYLNGIHRKASNQRDSLELFVQEMNLSAFLESALSCFSVSISTPQLREMFPPISIAYTLALISTCLDLQVPESCLFKRPSLKRNLAKIVATVLRNRTKAMFSTMPVVLALARKCQEWLSSNQKESDEQRQGNAATFSLASRSQQNSIAFTFPRARLYDFD